MSLKNCLNYAIGGLIAAVLLCGAQSRAYADLKWSETSKSVTSYSETVPVEYHFKNADSAPVRIDEVNPSCSCLTGSASEKVIRPGHEGQIRVVYRPHGRLGGEFASILVVSYSGTTQSVQSLKLNVDVRQLFTLSPSPVIWKKGDPAKGKLVRIISSQPESESPAVVAVTGAEPNFKVSITKPSKSAGRGTSFTLTPLSTAVPSHQLMRILLRTEKQVDEQAMISAIIQPN